MKVIVNWALCDGNGNCVREAPELFAMSDDDTLLVLKETFDDAYRAKGRSGGAVVPEECIASWPNDSGPAPGVAAGPP